MQLDGWSQVNKRDVLKAAPVDVVLRGCEALLIHVLGTSRVVKPAGSGSRAVKLQIEMSFRAAEKWDQLEEVDALANGVARRVDPSGFTDSWYRSQVNERAAPL